MSRPIGLIIRPLLPDDWVERKHDPPGRVYQAAYGRPPGELRMSVCPPMALAKGESLDRQLRELIDTIAPDAGRRVAEHAGESTLGRLYTVLFRNDRAGLLQVWVSAGPKGAVMATFTMGGLETVRQELSDAMAIVESLDLEERDMTGLHSAWPGPPR